MPALRASVNRPAGTYETKSTTVKKDHENARAKVAPLDAQLKATFNEYGN
ncbi:hypothetical protein H310_15206 [Aphanomyces invadans]|uniref:Uncharacterized protein n=1 Tax=Aphanomyces invadans TaxID=157072 RepID=A0A024T7N1_9STRA|nr:hypothetical protein H310_15206 [Aphanomyces invadans]ETV89955.1 hypothetical protein H310_15206 [Aphanomyces invadans]|eukprot:XP_008881413.1 hypothetical protein H310_15206 [Aphanomyces invadans]